MLILTFLFVCCYYTQIFFNFLYCEELSLKKNPCTAKKHCGECIVTHYKCAWCQKEDYGLDGKPRCDFLHNLMERGCEISKIIDPTNFLQKLINKPLSHPGTVENFVQIAPQALKIGIRPKKPITFKVKFRQAEDYPIDLYYLMDLSNSMEDDKEKLALLGDLLGTSMRNITSNFRVGFGSFVDKVVMPYVSVVPEKLARPCERCAAPYSYKNHLSLTSDTYRFADEIKTALVSGNLDAPEGGLDAIMQAIVCRDEIGWRPKARNLLIFSTDASFHFAGDGKLGGIVKPNDGQCHLDSSGYYTQSTTQDYPSVSQIIQKVREKAVNIIFAITGEQLPIYQKFSEILEGSTVGQLANDSSNIVELVKENYNKITSKVELKDNALPNITVSYESSCLGTKSKKTKLCEGLKVGDTVTFDVTVTLESCLKGQNIFDLRINPIGIGEELNIKLESICECDCAAPPQAEYDSPKCSEGHGTFECGACRCHENRFGRNCECDSSAHLMSEGGIAPSLAPSPLCLRRKSDPRNSLFHHYSNTTSPNPDPFDQRFPDEEGDSDKGPVCSGRGDCVCGVCECWPRDNPNEIVSGEFCECDNFSCDRYEGKICGGRGRGTCECGSCACAPGWVGEACQCPSTNASCISSNGKLCNGVGVCDCGVCICDASPSASSSSDHENRYRGPTCEECPTCPGLCSENRACVQCLVFKSGPLFDSNNLGSNLPDQGSTACDQKCSQSPIVVDDLIGSIGGNKENPTLCQFKDDDDCTFYFNYHYDLDRNLVIKVQKNKACPPIPALLPIILPIVIGIIMIGLIVLLIWKLITYLHDTREFAKFEKDKENAKWDSGENPIFRQATSTYKNPTFRKNR